MDTIAPDDDIIEEKIYPSSCPAQFFSILGPKTNTSSHKSDDMPIGSLTILSLLEDPVLPEDDNEDTHTPVAAIHEDEEYNTGSDDDDSDVFLVD